MKCESTNVHQELLEKIKEDQINDEELEELSNLFKTLGDPTRIRILFILRDVELCVCDIAACLNMTQSAVSHQLKVLRLTNLVRYKKIGKEVFYTLADDHVKYLFNIGLDHVRE